MLSYEHHVGSCKNATNLAHTIVYTNCFIFSMKVKYLFKEIVSAYLLRIVNLVLSQFWAH